MRIVFGFVLLIGIGLAGAAVYMARDYFEQQKMQLAEAEAAKSAIVPTAEVFVANKQLRYGERLTAEDITPVRWPVAAIPEGSFTTMEELFPNGEEEERSVLRAMEPNEAIMAVKVTEPGERAGVSARLSPGMRAFAIQTDVTSGVSGLLRPGDRVDVYWTGAVGEQNATRLVQANVELIAIDQSADEDRNHPQIARTVTVEVSPEQVARLTQAQATGRLTLSLVGVEDQVVSNDVEISQSDFLNIEPEEVAAQERKCYVRRRNGEETISVEIPCTN